jgi:hypothetical protein
MSDTTTIPTRATTINPSRMPYVIVWEAIGGLRRFATRDGIGDSTVTSGFLTRPPAERRLDDLNRAQYRRVIHTRGFDRATERQRERRAERQEHRDG